MKLAVVSTHPIQYNAPWFKLLTETKRVQFCVFYTWGQSVQGAKYDPDFGRNIEWDIPLLDGYEYRFLKNVAKDPGTHHFRGIINPDLISAIEAWKPDAVMVFGWNFHSHLACLRHFKNKLPVLFRGDSTLIDEVPGIRKLFRRIFLKWVYTHVDYAFYVGSRNKDYFFKHGLKSEQLIFAPHAVDNDRFSEPDAIYLQEAKAWRQKLAITEDHLVLLYAGKLEPKKCPYFLIDLAKSVNSDRLKILIVGNGILEEKLKKQAEGNSRIQFIDFQNQKQMPVVYRLGDIFILPSKGPGETWGLAINEAMASGLPIMVSDKVGCAIDLVQEEKNGLVFNSVDTAECEKFILKCLDSRDTLSTMGEHSRHIIRQYSFQHIIDSIDKFLGDISPSEKLNINSTHEYPKEV
jgi:glycosyltransferase involved in cell wall biosynthesis